MLRWRYHVSDVCAAAEHETFVLFNIFTRTQDVAPQNMTAEGVAYVGDRAHRKPLGIGVGPFAGSGIFPTIPLRGSLDERGVTIELAVRSPTRGIVAEDVSYVSSILSGINMTIRTFRNN